MHSRHERTERCKQTRNASSRAKKLRIQQTAVEHTMVEEIFQQKVVLPYLSSSNEMLLLKRNETQTLSSRVKVM